MSREQNLTKLDKISSELDDIDRKIIAALIQKPNVTDEAIAQSLGISRQTVNRRRNSDPVRLNMRRALAIPTSEMQRLMAKALAKMEQHLDDLDPKVSIVAATQLLKFGREIQLSPNNKDTILTEIGGGDSNVPEVDFAVIEQKLIEKLRLRGESGMPAPMNELMVAKD